MTLTANLDTPELELIPNISPLEFGVAASTHIYAGDIGCLNSDGNVTFGAVSTALIALGRVEREADNSAGAAGDIRAKVKPGIYRYANGDSITIADRGTTCYMGATATVYSTDGGGTRSIAGVVVDVDTSGVWVALGFEFLSSPAATPNGTVQKKTVSIDATITGSADTNGTACTPINVGTALPTGAIVLACELDVTTPASGGSVSTATIDVGWSGTTTALMKGLDLVAASAGLYDGVNDSASAPDRVVPTFASGKQIALIVTPDAGHKLSALTALAASVTVYYFVAF